MLDQVFQRDFPSWTVGLSFSYPLGRGYERAGLASARIQEQQARLRLQNLEVKAIRQLRQAAWQMETNAQRIGTSRLARELAEQRTDAERKRFEVGMSTSFLVVQSQRDLAQARNNELAAMLDYRRAVIDFEALQEAGPGERVVGVDRDGQGIVGDVDGDRVRIQLWRRPDDQHVLHDAVGDHVVRPGDGIGSNPQCLRSSPEKLKLDPMRIPPCQSDDTSTGSGPPRATSRGGDQTRSRSASSSVSQRAAHSGPAPLSSMLPPAMPIAAKPARRMAQIPAPLSSMPTTVCRASNGIPRPTRLTSA